ncbi:PA2169 family four-helix-bundle protein [Emcibacter sp. SYSU 3D8]|uniref:PA2169 family four-helix-bundle protein n=1 Tax=Emcibacter sp. SYSU 3D8 TaxID=3133969 RepID=UPI0031FF294D
MNRSDTVTVLSRTGSKLADDASALSGDAVKLLETIYADARDSARGYREAAEAATSGAMKARLYGMARRRNAMAGQLEITMRSLGLETGHDASVTEKLRHYFDELKSKLETGDTRAAIAGIIRGEGAFVESIDKALRESLPDAIHGFLERQQRQVKGAIDRFSGDIASSDRLAALKQTAIKYRKPALFVLLALGVAGLATAAIVQQRRHGAVTRSLASARGALDRALAQLPSQTQVRQSLRNIDLPTMRMPDINMPHLRMPVRSDLKMPSFLKRR